MWGVPAEDYEVDPIIESALNKLFILHADHEQNCSTSTVRVGSSQANLYSSVSAGVSALWDRSTAAPTKRSSRCSKPFAPKAALAVVD